MDELERAIGQKITSIHVDKTETDERITIRFKSGDCIEIEAYSTCCINKKFYPNNPLRLI